VFAALKKNWMGDTETLASETGLNRGTVNTALTAYTQAGRVIYDINKKLFRVRELSREPLPAESLRFSSPQEELAVALLNGATIAVKSENVGEDTRLLGSIKVARRTFNPELIINTDERITGGNCDCSFYIANKLYKGPCEHMIALRLAAAETNAVEK